MRPLKDPSISKPKETRHEKFERLARDRLDKVKYHMGLIRNLGTNATYEYTKADVDWIRYELNMMFDEVLVVFDKPKG